MASYYFYPLALIAIATKQSRYKQLLIERGRIIQDYDDEDDDIESEARYHHKMGAIEVVIRDTVIDTISYIAILENIRIDMNNDGTEKIYNPKIKAGKT